MNTYYVIRHNVEGTYLLKEPNEILFSSNQYGEAKNFFDNKVKEEKYTSEVPFIKLVSTKFYGKNSTVLKLMAENRIP